jgi:site-specific recombinase XerD
MSRAELIYPLRQRIESEVSLASKDPHNKEILLRYYKVRSCEVRLATLVIDFIRLNMMSRMLNKKFEEATVQDIEDLVFKINQRHSNPNTQNKCRKILKSFYRWMKGFPAREFPQEVKWIKLNKVPLVKVKAEDLIPYQECVRISELATNLRDKALFQCNLDAGCRIGEILTVKVGEVKFNDAGAILYSDGKTGNQPCILTWSAKTLALWLNNHPFRNDENSPLWTLLDRDRPKQLSYAAARRAFIKCVRKAGYTRRVWLHLLKHVSSTTDANNGMPDP